MTRPLITVLKFGSSVLPTRRSLGAAVHEIYRELRAGRRVIAVVSALGRNTDALYSKARRYGKDADAHARALLVSTGELAAAGELALALSRHGLSAQVFDPVRAGLLAAGPAEDARLVSVDAEGLFEALARHLVLVLPGYIARDGEGRTLLLGRGGSDLTALFLAQELGARARLLKDVDGIHSADPARERDTRRYAELTWDEALAVAGEVVQEKALRYAREHALEFEVAALGSDQGTRIGPRAARFHAERAPAAPLRVALCGLGTVGYGVWRELARRKRGFEVVSILVRGSRKRRPRRVPMELLTTERSELFASRPDVLIELLGGVDEPERLLAEALEQGISVVTANKALVAERGAALDVLARAGSARVLYGATVGGALPALESVRALAQRSGITRLSGVLNATSNFVIECLARGDGLDRAIARAASLGLCEADVSADLDGTDAAHKLELLASAALDAGSSRGGVSPRAELIWQERQGIEFLDPVVVRAVHSGGDRIRLVATARLEGGRAWLSLGPRRLRAGDPLHDLPGEHNGLWIECADGSSLCLRGLGAGRAPTTLAVLGDLLELSRAWTPSVQRELQAV